MANRPGRVGSVGDFTPPSCIWKTKATWLDHNDGRRKNTHQEEVYENMTKDAVALVATCLGAQPSRLCSKPAEYSTCFPLLFYKFLISNKSELYHLPVTRSLLRFVFIKKDLFYTVNTSMRKKVCWKRTEHSRMLGRKWEIASPECWDRS